MRENTELVLGKILMWTLVSVTLVVTPLWSLDPINPIKMLTVCAFGFMGLGGLLANQRALKLARYKVPLMIIGGFMGWQGTLKLNYPSGFCRASTYPEMRPPTG